MQAIVSQLAPALAAALFTVVVSLVGLAADALRKKLKSERALNVLARLEHLATDVVLETEQTVVADLKGATQDGVLSKSDATDVATGAFNKLKRNLGEQGVKEAVSALGLQGEGQLDSLLKSKLEASVARLPSAP